MISQKKFHLTLVLTLLTLCYLISFSCSTDSTGMTVLWEYGNDSKRLQYAEATLLGYNNESNVLIDFREYNLVGDETSEQLNITAGYYWKSSVELTNFINAGATVQNLNIAEKQVLTIQHTILYNEIERIYTYDNSSGVLVKYQNSNGEFINLLSWSEVNVKNFADEENSIIPGFPILITAIIILITSTILQNQKRRKKKP